MRSMWSNLGGALPRAAFLFVILVILLAVLAPIIAPFNPNEMELSAILSPPSLEHLMGTDQLGRDLFSRILYGARPSLMAAIGIVLIGSIAGLVLGTVSGLMGGWVDNLIMRFMDIMMALPGLVIALALTAALGPSLKNAVIAIGILSIPGYARVVRGQALSLRSREYVLASRLMGASSGFLISQHLVPNIFPTLLVFITFQLGGAILASSALSFIGLGIQPPDPEWGAIVGAGRNYVLVSWWVFVFPGIAITLTAASFNILGDSMRDYYGSR